jgi:hypothetical protein
MIKDNDKAFGYAPELPEDVRPMFQDLCQDLTSLHGKWRFYLELFSDHNTVDLLNDVAMASFQMVEESLRSDITMSICRLCDPAKSRGQNNLSINVLVEKFSEVPGLLQLRDDFQSCCAPVRQYRNKRVGHNDLKAALQPHDTPLPNVTRPTIDSILSAAAKLVNHVYRFHTNGELCFEPFDSGGGTDLVFWLKIARNSGGEKGVRNLFP